MKKVSLLLLTALIAFPITINIVGAEVQIIGDWSDAGTSAHTLEIGETYNIEKKCDIKLLSFVADEYVFSIQAYERDENELLTTPKYRYIDIVHPNIYTGDFGYSHWDNDRERYKFKNRDGVCSYSDMYLDLGAAVKAQSDDFLLIDIRMEIANCMIAPFDIKREVSAKLISADEYEFPVLGYFYEIPDCNGTDNEWLEDAGRIPSSEKKNVHIVFEVPYEIAAGTDSLVSELEIGGESFEVILR